MKEPFALPDDMVLTLPFGYKVKIQKRRIGPHHGDWMDFNANRVATIRIRRQDPFDEQLDTLRHELEHMLADFGGILRKMENEFRAFKQEESE